MELARVLIVLQGVMLYMLVSWLEIILTFPPGIPREEMCDSYSLYQFTLRVEYINAASSTNNPILPVSNANDSSCSRIKIKL